MPKTSKVVGKSRYSLHVWIDMELGKAFDSLVNGVVPRTSKTAVTEAALVEYLESRGMWPPKDRKK